MCLISDVQVLTKYKYKRNLKALEKVLQKLAEAGLKLNTDIPFFGKTKTEYLGFWVSNQGVRPLSSKVDAVNKIDIPTKIPDVRGFWGQ